MTSYLILILIVQLISVEHVRCMNIGIKITVKYKYETFQPVFLHYVIADKPDFD